MNQVRIALALLAVALLGTSLSGGLTGTGDRSEARQRAILEHWATAYTPGVSRLPNCFALERDVRRLLAAVSLHQRFDATHPKAISPAAAEPLWNLLLSDLTAGVGLDGAPSVCSSTINVSTVNIAVHLAYIRAKYGGAWAPSPGLIDLVERGNWLTQWKPQLSNTRAAIFAMEALTCEATGYAPICAEAALKIQETFVETATDGASELGAPHYQHHTLEKLILLSDVLTDPVMLDQVNAMRDYTLLWEGSHYLPGGGLSAVQARDGTAGGARDANSRVLDQFFVILNDPAFERRVSQLDGGVVGITASGYRIDAALRSIFLDKRSGYTVSSRLSNQAGSGVPSGAPFGNANITGLGLHAAMKTIVGPQTALFQIAGAYHHPLNVIPNQFVSGGAKVPCPSVPGLSCNVYQYAPAVTSDRNDAGGTFGNDADPDDGKGELPDFERQVFHRTQLTIWDPEARQSRWDSAIAVPRATEGTRAFVPEWDDAAIGGTKDFPTSGDPGWRVGKVGNACIGWLPLQEGSLAESSVAAGGEFSYAYRFFELAGKSAGILVGSTPDEDCPDLATFAADLASRHAACDWDDVNDLPVCQFDARGPDGALHRMRLEYLGDTTVGIGKGNSHSGEETRYLCSGGGCPAIAGDWSAYEITLDSELDNGLLSSDFCAWDDSARTITCDPGSTQNLSSLVIDFGTLLSVRGQGPPAAAETPAVCVTPDPITITTEFGTPGAWVPFSVSNCGFGGALTNATVNDSTAILSGCSLDADSVAQCAVAGLEFLPPGTYPFTVSVSDSAAPNVAIKRGDFVVEAAAFNAAPTIAPIPDQNFSPSGLPAILSVAVTDPEGDSLTCSLANEASLPTLCFGLIGCSTLIVGSGCPAGEFSPLIEATDDGVPPASSSRPVNVTISPETTGNTPLAVGNSTSCASDGITTASSVSCALPSGAAAGNLVIAHVSLDGLPGETTTTAGPAFTDSGSGHVETGPAGNEVTSQILYRVLDGTESGQTTFSWDTNAGYWIELILLTGNAKAPPIDVIGRTVGFQFTAAPAVTTTVDPTLVLRLASWGGPTDAFDQPNPGTPIHSGTNGDLSSLGVWENGPSPAGATFAQGLSRSGPSAANVGWTVALASNSTAPDIAEITDKVYLASDLPETISLVTTDPDADTRTCTVSTPAALPAGCVTVTDDCTATGTGELTVAALPTCEVGTFGPIVVTATANGETDAESFQLTIGDQQPPILAPIGNLNFPAGVDAQIPISCSDSNGDSLTLTASGTALPCTVALNDNADGTGEIDTGGTGCDASDNVTGVVIECDDGTSVDSESISISFGNQAPVIGTFDTFTITEGIAGQVDVTGADPNGDSITFSVSGEALPDCVTFADNTPNASSARFSWTSACVAGVTCHALNLIDSENNSSGLAFSIEIEADNGNPPGSGPCQDGVDCFCDLYPKGSSGPNNGAGTVQFCADHESPLLYAASTPVGNGAPNYGPVFDETGGGTGNRGFNWQFHRTATHGSAPAWGNGEPSSPRFGSACSVSGGCDGKKVACTLAQGIAADNQSTGGPLTTCNPTLSAGNPNSANIFQRSCEDCWGGNDDATIQIARDLADFSFFESSIAAPTFPGGTGCPDGGGQCFLHLTPPGVPGGQKGDSSFLTPLFDSISIGGVYSFSINHASGASELWNQTNRANELGSSGDYLGLFVSPADGNLRPLRTRLTYEDPATFGQPQCQATTLTEHPDFLGQGPIGSVSCGSAVEFKPDPARYSQPQDWPFGAWAAVVTTISGVQSPTMCIRQDVDNGAELLTVLALCGFDPDDFEIGNDGWGLFRRNGYALANESGSPTSEYGWRGEDNLLVVLDGGHIETADLVSWSSDPPPPPPPGGGEVVLSESFAEIGVSDCALLSGTPCSAQFGDVTVVGGGLRINATAQDSSATFAGSVNPPVSGKTNWLISFRFDLLSSAASNVLIEILDSSDQVVTTVALNPVSDTLNAIPEGGGVSVLPESLVAGVEYVLCVQSDPAIAGVSMKLDPAGDRDCSGTISSSPIVSGIMVSHDVASFRLSHAGIGNDVTFQDVTVVSTGQSITPVIASSRTAITVFAVAGVSDAPVETFTISNGAAGSPVLQAVASLSGQQNAGGSIGSNWGVLTGTNPVSLAAGASSEFSLSFPGTANGSPGSYSALIPVADNGSIPPASDISIPVTLVITDPSGGGGGGMEQLCEELGPFCICSEPMDNNDFPVKTPLPCQGSGCDARFNPSDSTTKECGSGGNGLTWSEPKSTGGGTQSVPETTMPPGNTVTYHWRKNDDGTHSWSGVNNFSSRTPSRMCTRYYYRHSANWPEVSAPGTSPGKCRRDKMVDIHPKPNSPGIRYQMAWHSSKVSFNTIPGDPPMSVVNGSAFVPSDCYGKWCRVESCVGGAPMDGSPRTLNLAFRITNDVGKTVTYAPEGGGTVFYSSSLNTTSSDVWLGDLYSSGTCNEPSLNTYTDYSHGMQAEWPTDTGQWIGPAYEVEPTPWGP